MTSGRPTRVATLRPPSERDLRRAMAVATDESLVPHAIIQGGPNREALFDALKYALDSVHPHKTSFKINAPGTDLFVRVPMRVVGIHQADGSGSSFLVTAEQVAASFIPDRPTFYYSTANRTGRIPFGS